MSEKNSSLVIPILSPVSLIYECVTSRRELYYLLVRINDKECPLPISREDYESLSHALSTASSTDAGDFSDHQLIMEGRLEVSLKPVSIN